MENFSDMWRRKAIHDAAKIRERRGPAGRARRLEANAGGNGVCEDAINQNA